MRGRDRRRSTRRVLVLACGLLLGVPTAQAFSIVISDDSGNRPNNAISDSFVFVDGILSDDIVFDFEDGLQGWTLEGSNQRVNTQVLGGQWAIFGDGFAEGGASMSNALDLTGVAEIQVEMFFLGEPFDDFVPPILIVTVPGLGQAERTRTDPTANPALLTFDVSDFSGLNEVRMSWADSLDCPAVGPCTVPDDLLLALVDNITLVPIPEPPTLALVGLALGALALGRRR